MKTPDSSTPQIRAPAPTCPQPWTAAGLPSISKFLQCRLPEMWREWNPVVYNLEKLAFFTEHNSLPFPPHGGHQDSFLFISGQGVYPFSPEGAWADPRVCRLWGELLFVIWIFSSPRNWQSAALSSSPPATWKGLASPLPHAHSLLSPAVILAILIGGKWQLMRFDLHPIRPWPWTLVLGSFATFLSWWPMYIFWHFLIGLFPSYCWIWVVLCVSCR